MRIETEAERRLLVSTSLLVSWWTEMAAMGKANVR